MRITTIYHASPMIVATVMILLLALLTSYAHAAWLYPRLVWLRCACETCWLQQDAYQVQVPAGSVWAAGSYTPLDDCSGNVCTTCWAAEVR